MQFTRRDFLKLSLGAPTLLALGASPPLFLSRAALAAQARSDENGRVLVVVQLSGGNDGLNTVVPFEDDLYAKNRPTLRLSSSQVLKIDSLLGFHPRCEAFLRLTEQGRLAIVQGVGYEASSRDHDEALRDWQTAQPGKAGSQTGWIGRAADGLASTEGGAPAAFLGAIEKPFAANAERVVVPSIRSLDEVMLQDPPGPTGAAHELLLARASRMPQAGSGNPLSDVLRQTAAEARAGSLRLRALVGKPVPPGYPDFQLARTLGDCARLIRAELGIRILFVELGGGGIGGFDSHANQAANHGALLEQLSASVSAFVEDLAGDGLLDRVIVMTFSEFGRTLVENGRRGTDHGSAAPVFVAGGKVKAGWVGPHPRLDDLDQGSPRFHTDFRRVYATALRWLGCDHRGVLGDGFEPLDILQA